MTSGQYGPRAASAPADDSTLSSRRDRAPFSPAQAATTATTQFRRLGLLQQLMAAVALAVLVAFAWFSWVQHKTYLQFEAEFANVLRLRDTIAELDQSLTVNAILVAATGDASWESLYREHEILLEGALAEADAVVEGSSFSGQVGATHGVDTTSAANTLLVELEDRAMESGKAGRSADALEILTSDTYRNAKLKYNQGLVALSRSLQRHIQEWGSAIASESLLLGKWAIVVVVLNCAAALLMVIAHRRRTRQFQGELAENRELLALAMISADIEPWDWNVITGELTLSESFIASLGYEPSEFVPHIDSWRDLLHSADKPAALEAAERALQNQDSPYVSTFRLRANDGNWRSFAGRGRVVTQTADGAAARVVGTFLDVTERVQLESQLVQSQKLESIGQLAAGIAHEINTPMQFVSDNVEYLSECCERLFEVVNVYEDNLLGTAGHKSWEERRSELTDVIERNKFTTIREQVPQAISESLEGIQRVISIVRAMKEFSHQGEEESVGIDLNNAVRSTIMISRNRWKYVADLDTDLDPDLPTLRCSPAEINQVLLNLVVNAADAVGEKVGEHGDNKGHITLRTKAMEDQVIVEVIDTGGGIPPDIRDRIFDPFFTTKEVGKGTGQGLAICYNIVVNKRHGAIEVESEPGVGTTFRIKLPIVGRSSPQDTRCDDSAIAPAEALID